MVHPEIHQQGHNIPNIERIKIDHRHDEVGLLITEVNLEPLVETTLGQKQKGPQQIANRKNPKQTFERR